jgi:hypothetical protein
MGSGARRRQRCTPPRDAVVRVKFTAAEKTALADAADRTALALAAYIGRAAMDAAEHRAAPVDNIDREILLELIRARNLVGRAGGNLNQAVARLHATGQPGPDLAPAAAYLTRVTAHVDDAALAVSRKLKASRRRTRAADVKGGPAPEG